MHTRTNEGHFSLNSKQMEAYNGKRDALFYSCVCSQKMQIDFSLAEYLHELSLTSFKSCPIMLLQRSPEFIPSV